LRMRLGNGYVCEDSKCEVFYNSTLWLSFTLSLSYPRLGTRYLGVVSHSCTVSFKFIYIKCIILVDYEGHDHLENSIPDFQTDYNDELYLLPNKSKCWCHPAATVSICCPALLCAHLSALRDQTSKIICYKKYLGS
jgi:hypothetical protein